jgi:hypothetical protein
MDAKDHPVISVLGDQKRFMVPIYQRQYSWYEKHWGAFWDDVVAKAEETFEGKPKFKHYMGALIIAPGIDGYTVGTTPKVQVVDGQQRLTTFQIFLAAIREVSSRKNFPEVADSVQNYLFNRPMTGDVDADAKFKLVPTPEDKQVFHDIIDGNWTSIKDNYPDAFYKKGTLRSSAAPAAIKALALFIDKVENYILFGVYDPEEETPDQDDEAMQRRRLHALLEALLNHLKLVVITLDESDDAQVIFETLNSKAEPLLAMDLVRNNIFHRAEAQGEAPQKLFEIKWRPLDGPFWKSDSPRAKPRRPRIDHFLSHALTAQTGKETSVRELYAEYRAFTRPKGQPRFKTVESELDALLRFAPSYQLLEEGAEDTSLGRLGAKLSTWEVTTAYPLIFCIASTEIDDLEKRALYQLIYSYLVRRAVCGLSPKSFNKTFPRIVGALLENGVSRTSFASAFSGQTGPAVRFPSDDEFRAAIINNPLYQWILKKERLADILWELELKVRTKFSVGTPRPAGMSIEHILPQGWTEHWLLPDGRKAPLDGQSNADEQMLSAITARQSALHTFGNLTLITIPGNSAASHSAFDKKKAWLKKSLLALNLAICERQVWNEAEIQRRSNSLAQLAIKIWPSLTG